MKYLFSRQQHLFLYCVATCLLMSHFGVMALNPKACGFFKGLSCAANLTKAVNQCKESYDIEKCLKTISEYKDCINCTCSAFPQYCSEKKGDIAPKPKGTSICPFSSVKISKDDTHYIDIVKIVLSALKCEPNLFSTCEEKLKKISGHCLLEEPQSVFQCIKHEISKTECTSCLCKLVPSVCAKINLPSAPVPSEIEKPAQQAASAKLSEVILGGLMQSGAESQSLLGLIDNDSMKESASNLISDMDVQSKLKNVLENEQISGSIQNFIGNSKPEEITDIAQSIVGSNIPQMSFSNLVEEKLQKLTGENKADTFQQLIETYKPVSQRLIPEQQQQCDEHQQKKCQLSFLKLLTTCPIFADDQKECVYKHLNGSNCEGCVCTFIKNLC